MGRGSVKIVNNINELDMNSFSVDDQIVLIEEYVDHGLGRYTEKSVSYMILREMVLNSIYIFETTTCYGDQTSEGSKLRSKNKYSKVYLLSKDNKLMFLYDGEYIHVAKFDVNEYTMLHNKNVETTIFNNIFNEENSSDIISLSEESEQTIVKYVSLYLNDDDRLVIVNSNEFNFEKRKWHPRISVRVYNKSGTYFHLDVDPRYFIDDLEGLKCYDDVYYEKLREMLFVTFYEMLKYRERDFQQKKTDINIIGSYLELDSSVIERFFSHVWKREDIGLRVFLSKIKVDYFSCSRRVQIDGKDMYVEEIKDLEIRNLVERELRKAEAFVYFNYSYNGTRIKVNPEDGLIYRSNEIDYDFMETNNYVKDYEVVCYKTRREKNYYVNIDGYYVSATSKDEEIIREFHERMKMLEDLRLDI